MSSFTFSDCPTTVSLADGERDGKAVATGSLALNVRNVTARSLIGTLSIQPDDMARSGWFRIAGAASTDPGRSEVDYGANTAQTVKVDITVPEGAAPGRKVFNLRIVATDRPDNDFADSPAIAFEVKAPPAKVEPKKAFPWWIAAVAALVVVVVGGVIWSLLPADDRVVPKGLTGTEYGQAVFVLARSDIDLGDDDLVIKTVTVGDKPNMQVIDVNPPEGSFLKAGQKLVLSVNTIAPPPPTRPCVNVGPLRSKFCIRAMELIVRPQR